MTRYTARMSRSIATVMNKVRAQFEASGLSLEELGQKMGAATNSRQTAWQFLNKTTDPRLSMLIRFADAIGKDVKDLL